MAFERLDLKAVSCFGWSRPIQPSWVELAKKSVSSGWTIGIAKQIDEKLAQDVSKSFERLIQCRFIDLATNIYYKAYFDNSRGLWYLEIIDSPKAQILDDDLNGFFGSDGFKRFAKRCSQILTDAKQVYDETIKEHLENGELLSVSEQKLDWILRDLDVGRFMDNLRDCRYGKK